MPLLEPKTRGSPPAPGRRRRADRAARLGRRRDGEPARAPSCALSSAPSAVLGRGHRPDPLRLRREPLPADPGGGRRSRATAAEVAGLMSLRGRQRHPARLPRRRHQPQRTVADRRRSSSTSAATGAASRCSTTARRVRVGPGTVLGHVNRVLAPYGRRLGPDPASTDIATVGGVDRQQLRRDALRDRPRLLLDRQRADVRAAVGNGDRHRRPRRRRALRRRRARARRRPRSRSATRSAPTPTCASGSGASSRSRTRPDTASARSSTPTSRSRSSAACSSAPRARSPSSPRPSSRPCRCRPRRRSPGSTSTRSPTRPRRSASSSPPARPRSS